MLGVSGMSAPAQVGLSAAAMAVGIGVLACGGTALASAAPDPSVSTDGRGRVVSTRSESSGRSDSAGTVPRSPAGRNPRSVASARVLAPKIPATSASRRAPEVGSGKSVARGTARRAAGRTAGFFAPVAAFFNNQTPRLSPTQVAQSPAGVVTGTLNPVDPDSDQLTFTVASPAAHGTATVSADGSWTFTPAPSVALTGVTDSFEVTVSDAASGFALHGLAGLVHLLSFGLIGRRGDSSTATVVVVVTPFDAVNSPPTGIPAITGIDPLTGVVNGSINGSDADGDPLSYTVTASPAKGAVILSAAGTFAYEPTPEARTAAGAPDATAADRSDIFNVTISDGRGGSAAVGVPVSVSPVEQSVDSDYRQEMRAFVIDIAQQARLVNPDFIVIPQNGQELITQNGEADGPLSAAYAAAIDGQGREDLFYGYNSDNVATPAADRNYMLEFLDRQEAEGIQVLVTDYASSAAKVDNSYAKNAEHGFISFAANHRDLDTIPPRPAEPVGVNADDITNLAQARNFLYVLDPGRFRSQADYLDALAATNYDVVIIDAFYDDQALTAADVAALQTKANGGRRLVIAYMSIGEAEDYRYYWQAGWRPGSPSWLDVENPDWAGNYKVRYWEQGWQDIILSGPDAYLNRITAAGFDGVYLDLIDAFEYFE